MNPTLAWEAVQSWSAEDRLAFAFRLWDQLLEEGFEPELTDELAAELDRRMAAHEADPNNVRTWEQVLERIKARS
jgi:putative addiction module component (TIGR02574 family)